MNLWAAEWCSKNKLDGEWRHFMNENCLPVLFRTRAACRAWIDANYDYIRHRKDLRQEPLGWRMPKPVKVVITKAVGVEVE